MQDRQKVLIQAPQSGSLRSLKTYIYDEELQVCGFGKKLQVK